ncbi:hypothetical protein JCM24511_06493 [Saitozyma sp. JCM 24511]|nr:hypothetical protein JCM24511_06493 [Saitozyma sp. JCM 24511]
MADQTNIIFEDRFTVEDVDKDGKKFDRGELYLIPIPDVHFVLRTHPAPVSRITARSHNLSMQLTLDIANELYPLTSGETFTLALARSLSPEEELAANGDEEGSEAGGKRVKKEMWRSEDQGLAADYEYVMYGKVSERPTAYMSFGGLLLALRGSYRHLAGVVVGENVYLLMRK